MFTDGGDVGVCIVGCAPLDVIKDSSKIVYATVIAIILPGRGGWVDMI